MGTTSEHLNFDFAQPVNGNLTQTSKGLLYTPDKNFEGNDTFIIQIQKSEPGNYSTTQVKILVAGLGGDDRGLISMISPYVSAISAAIAGIGLIFVARSSFFTSRSIHHDKYIQRYSTT